MIPSYISEESSNAERKLFRLFNNSDDLKDWVCLHSLGVIRHLRKREGEMDFVLIGPPGIFVIEVKGGRVSRDEGVWSFTDRHGRVSTKRESPFEQARTALYSLRQDIQQNCAGTDRNILYGYGAAFPDIEFKIQSPEWDSAMVYDSRSSSEPIGKYVRKLSEYWTSRQPSIVPIDKGTTDRITKFLRGNFDTIRPVGIDVRESEDALLKLTEEQFVCLDAMSDNPRTLFIGPAGTGKTVLAAEKARRNAREGINTLFLCYNQMLAVYLRESFQAEGLQDFITVMTVHSYFQSSIKAAGYSKALEEVRGKVDDNKLYRDVYPELFLKAAELIQKYEYLIIDEAQDVLSDTYLLALDAILTAGLDGGSWTILLDPENQANLFERLSKEGLDHLKHAGSVYRLSINCRNTQPIAIQTAIISGHKLGTVAKTHGLPVEYSWFTNQHDQSVKVTQILRRLILQGIKPADIVILSPKSGSASLAGSGRLRAGAPIVRLDESNVAENRTSIAYSSVSAYKGLESAVIIFTDIMQIDTEWSRTVNYIGFTRARTMLVVSASEELQQAYLAETRTLSKRDQSSLSL